MFEFQMADIMPALPEIFLAGICLILVLVAAYGGETARNARRVTRIAMGGILITLALVVNGDPSMSRAFWRHVLG